jgi:hypothetical protein
MEIPKIQPFYRDCRKIKTIFMDGIISKKLAVPFEQNQTIGEGLRHFSTVSPVTLIREGGGLEVWMTA